MSETAQQQNPIELFFECFAQRVADIVIDRMGNAEKEANTPRFYSRKELAKILHVTLTTIDTMAKKGIITPRKQGRKVLYDAAEIDKAVKEKKIFRYKRNTIQP